IADVADDVTSFDVHGDVAYLLTYKDAPRYKVTALDLADSGATAAVAQTVVPAGEGVIKEVAVAADALYVRGIRGGPAELRKLPWKADGSPGPLAPVALPFPGTLAVFATDARVDGAIAG